METRERGVFDGNPKGRTDHRIPRSHTAIESGGNTRRRKGGFKPWLLLVIGLVVGLVGGFLLRPVVMPEMEVNAAPSVRAGSLDQINQPDPQEVMAAVVTQARHFDGDPDAPVTLVEFGDYSCGYCGKFAQDTLPQIREKYVKSGQVKLAHINYPILGPGSMAAAQAAECAAHQGSFWEYSDLLYANQSSGFSPDNVLALAEELGLDTADFEQCLADTPDQASLENDFRLGQMLGVRGTPAFLINGRPVSGALPYEQFEQIIEAALAGEF